MPNRGNEIRQRIDLDVITPDAIYEVLSRFEGGTTVLAKTPYGSSSVYINLKQYYAFSSREDKLDYIRNFILQNNRYITHDFVSISIYHSF